jgi:hypothetical protein
MDNILQFPKVESNSKDEIRGLLINNLIENGASKERADLMFERMSPFLDILCSFEFHPDFPENPKPEDYHLLFKQLSEKIAIFREELLLERISTESWNTQCD